MAEFICIVCPASCRLSVEETGGEVVVNGSGCKRGIAHGVSEYTSPMRMLTTTVVITGGALPRLPVISLGEVPKARLRACLEALYHLEAQAPVRCGQLICENICGTGVDIVAARAMREKS